MKAKTFILITLVALLWGCGGSKKVQGPAPASQPEWVKSRPTSSMFYYGIGIARKTSDVSQFQQTARQNALADMSSEISISISSNSVIHAFESNLNFREDFTSTIKTQTQQELEGYEQVDSWEDENSYWVYYRLSKSKYQELKELRKSNAVTRSLDLFTTALNARGAGEVRLAIVQLIKALEPIKPYFSEPLPVDYQGTQVFLGNEIFKELSSTLSAIELVPFHSAINIKTGQSIPSSLLVFEARHKVTGIIGELPLVVSYSEKPIRNNKQRAGSNGMASFDVDKVRSTKAFETFSATIDLDDILAEASSDAFISRLVSRFTLPQGVIRINIDKPVFVVISNEVNLGVVIQPGFLEESFRKKAIENGYLVKDDVSDADYIVQITAATSSRGESNQFKNVSLEGLISVETKDGNQLYHRPLEGFVGRNLDFKQAGEDAFKEARRKLEISYFREIHEAIGKR
jgi:hypothetical protein